MKEYELRQLSCTELDKLLEGINGAKILNDKNIDNLSTLSANFAMMEIKDSNPLWHDLHNAHDAHIQLAEKLTETSQAVWNEIQNRQD